MAINKHQQALITRKRKREEFAAFVEGRRITELERLKAERERRIRIANDAWIRYKSESVSEQLKEIERRRERNAMIGFFAIIGFIITLLTSFIVGVW